MSAIKTEDSAGGVNGGGAVYEDQEENDNSRCYGLLIVKIIDVFNNLSIQRYKNAYSRITIVVVL